MTGIVENTSIAKRNQKFYDEAMAKQAEERARALEDSAYNMGTQDAYSGALIQAREEVGNYLSNLVGNASNPLEPVGQVVGSTLYDIVQGAKDRLAGFDPISNTTAQKRDVERQLGAEIEAQLAAEAANSVQANQDLDYVLQHSRHKDPQQTIKEYGILQSKRPGGILTKDDLIYLMRDSNN